MARMKLWTLTLAAAGLLACSSDRNDGNWQFVGYVYDCVTGARLTAYTLTLLDGTSEKEADVSDTGRYVVGSLPAVDRKDDFTIEIVADGYRSFHSTNTTAALPNGGDVSGLNKRVAHYDAYVCPTNVQSPAANLQFFFADQTDARPSGQVRFQPIGSSDFYDTTDESPAAIEAAGTDPRQVWDNDDDKQTGTKIVPFSNGEATLAAGDLSYGVTYRVLVFGVDGYQYTTSTDYTAGVSGDRTFALSRLDKGDLKFVRMSNESGDKNPSGTLTIELNQPVVLAGPETNDEIRRALNVGFSFSAPNGDEDGDGADNSTLVLKTIDNMNPFARTVNFEIRGSSIILTSTYASAFTAALADADDELEITYGSLGSIMVRPANDPSQAPVSLAGIDRINTPADTDEVGTTQTVLVQD